MPPPFLHCLLAFQPTSRQSCQTRPELLWDLKDAPQLAARIASAPHEPLPYANRIEFATSPPLPVLHITCGLFPFDWPIEVRNDNGVNVGDVLEAIYKSLRHGIAKEDWANTSETQRKRVAEAFYERSRRSADPRYEHSQGVRRVDWLLRHTVFVGLSPAMDGTHTWSLTTKRADTAK